MIEDTQSRPKKVSLTANKEDVRLAIISDTHGLLDERIAAEIIRCDAVLHAGDICGQYILDDLTLLCDQVIAVTGNNDTAFQLKSSKFSGSSERITQSVLINLPGGDIGMEHGDQLGHSPSHAALRTRWPDARAIVYGHTHKQVWDREAIPWVINPGAAGETRTHGGASCIILKASEARWTVELKKFSDADSCVA